MPARSRPRIAALGPLGLVDPPCWPDCAGTFESDPAAPTVRTRYRALASLARAKRSVVEGELASQCRRVGLAWTDQQIALDFGPGLKARFGPTLGLTLEPTWRSHPDAAELYWGPIASLLAIESEGVVLHASAFGRERHTTVLIGGSGVGKSTLARAAGDVGAKRYADDQCFVDLLAAAVDPRFPQLGLSSAVPWPHQPGILGTLVELVALPADGELKLERLPPSETLRVCLANAVATRLLPPRWLGDVFDRLGRLVESVPGYRLHYPHRPPAIAQALALLQEVAR